MSVFTVFEVVLYEYKGLTEVVLTVNGCKRDLSMFFIYLHYSLLCKLWFSQLLNYNEAVTDLHIGPSLIYKQEWDTPVIAMFTTFWPLEMGTLHGRNISLKNQNARSFFLSHTCKLNQQTHWGVVSKSEANI